MHTLFIACREEIKIKKGEQLYKTQRRKKERDSKNQHHNKTNLLQREKKIFFKQIII